MIWLCVAITRNWKACATNPLLRIISTLKTKYNQSCTNLKNKTTKENYRLIKKRVGGNIVVLECYTKSWHIRQSNCDHVQTTIVGRSFKRNTVLSEKKMSLLAKGPLFVPTPSDIIYH